MKNMVHYFKYVYILVKIKCNFNIIWLTKYINEIWIFKWKFPPLQINGDYMTIKKDYLDKVHTDVPLTKFINEKLWKDIFYNEIYSSIMKTLNEKPITFNEIYKESIKLIHKKRSEASIYRDLRALINQNLILEVGHRVHPDKIFSKRLYYRSAEIILFKNADEIIWNSDSGDGLALVIGMIISRHYNNEKPIASIFRNYMLSLEKNFSHLRESTVRKFLEHSEEENQLSLKKKLKCITNFDAKDLYFFFNHLGLILGMLLGEKALILKQGLQTSFNQKKDKKTIQGFLTTTEKRQDYILYNPVLIKPIDAKIYDNRIRNNFNLIVILRMLSSGSMTLNEIHSNHHRMILERISYKNKTTSIPKPKSKNTIYKYIQELIESGFIIEAGRRPIPNQSATQKLYSRSAELFYRIEYRAEYWNSDNAKNVSLVIGQILCFVLKKNEFNHELLHRCIIQFVTEQTKSLEKALKTVKTTVTVDYIRKHVLVGGQESGTFLY
ncbi:MAG: hypothetical protein JSW11_03170, partial [Candidatus Heimdallarchaeota archaeon]